MAGIPKNLKLSVIWGFLNYFTPRKIIFASFGMLLTANVHASENQIKISREIEVEQTTVSRLIGEKAESSFRKQQAINALVNYLHAFLLDQNLVASDSPELLAWLKKTCGNRFFVYAPSWNITKGEGNKIQISFIFAQKLFLADFERSAYSLTSSAKNTENSNLGEPAAVLVLDEETKDVFVIPSEVSTKIPALNNKSNYVFKPGVNFTGKLDWDKLNLGNNSLAERAGIYAAAFKSKLGNKLYFDPDFAVNALEFLSGTAKMEHSFEAKIAWPPPLSFTISPLREKHGFLAVFVFRNAQKSGVLEKMDFWGFNDGTVRRSYWSRTFNDPNYADKPQKAMEKTLSYFQKQLNATVAKNVQGNIRLIVDKKINESVVVAVENILKTFLVKTDVILVPYEVNDHDIRYNTSVKLANFEKAVEQIRKAVPNAYVRMVPSEQGTIQILSTTTN